MANTKTDLVAILVERQKALRKNSLALARVIRGARSGKYHDWDSSLTTPKVQLVQDLRSVRAVDLSDLVARVIDGEFNEDPTPAQLEELRQEVGPEYYDRLFPEDAQRRGKA